jgi:hypothetical protein
MAKRDSKPRREGARVAEHWLYPRGTQESGDGARGPAPVVVAVVVGYFAYRAAAPTSGTKMPTRGNVHIPTETTAHEAYNSDPPTSGPHLPYIAPWGIHTRPIVRELQVHNLEDGGVVVQYNCDCPDDVARARAPSSPQLDRFVSWPVSG